MKTADFDAAFDNGESVIAALDLKSAVRPGLKAQRVNVDFPAWMVRDLDSEADRLGVTRQSLIKLWLAERLDHRPNA
jgi:hypothetical protein